MEPAGKAIARFVKISPYKVRKVADLIRGKDVDSALAILKAANKRASVFLVRTLKSAIASAKQGGKIKQDGLYISKITADDGSMVRRYRAAAMGRATMIRKRTSHILIEVEKSASPVKKVEPKTQHKKLKTGGVSGS